LIVPRPNSFFKRISLKNWLASPNQDFIILGPSLMPESSQIPQGAKPEYISLPRKTGLRPVAPDGKPIIFAGRPASW
jgi:hypothetical protein